MSRRFWSNVFAVGFKEARVLRNDPAVIAMMLIQPVIMVLLFGGVVSNTPRHVPWAVLDRTQTDTSRRLVAEIAHSGYFLPPASVQSYDEAHARLSLGHAVAVLIVPETFGHDAGRGRARVQLLLDGSEPISAARVGAIVTQIAARFDTGGTGSPRAPIDVRQRFRFNPTLVDRVFYLAALTGMLLTNLCMSGSALGLVAERENGTYEQMLSLPTTPVQLVLGKLVPHVAMNYFVLALTTVLAGVIFGFWPRGNMLTLAVVALPFILASLGIGVFISTVAHTSAQAVFVTVFFILPSMVLSGMMLPYEFMPHPIREIGMILPLRWYAIAARRIAARGAGFVDVIGPTVILFVIFAVLMTLVRWRMKPRLG